MLPIIMQTGPLLLDIQEQAQGLRGEGSQEPWKSKRNYSNVLSPEAGSSMPIISFNFPNNPIKRDRYYSLTNGKTEAKTWSYLISGGHGRALIGA